MEISMDQSKHYFGKDLEAMSFARNYHNWILDEFKPYLNGHIAEVGAGMGNFSEFLLDAGIQGLVAFEPSDNMFSLLEQKFTNNEKVTAVHSLFERKSDTFKDSFDAVCYVNVLEHIEDDRAALAHAYKTLHQRGHILIFVPALSFLYSELDKRVGHFRRYTKQALIDTAASAGFTIKTIKYFDLLGILPWYFAFVLLKQTTTEANVSLYDRWAVPIMHQIEQLLTPPIGKNLLLIGQKL